MGYRLVNTKCMGLVEQWKKMAHSNLVTLRQVTTRSLLEILYFNKPRISILVPENQPKAAEITVVALSF